MELVLDKMIPHPAFLIAIAPDMSKIAVSGERTINVFSFPDLKKVGKVKVAHACSIAFLADSCSMVILNTTGKAFIWDGTKLESIGKWPVPKWQERPIFRCDGDYLLWAGYGGVWKYDVKERVIRNIFSSTQDIWICRCEEDSIKCVAMDYWETEKEVDILTISLDGAVKRRAMSDVQIRNGIIKSPAWSEDDLIAISTSVRPRFPLNALYLMDTEGRVLSQEWITAAEDNGSFYYGNGMFIKTSSVGAYNINFYDAHTMELNLKLDGQELASYGIDTPPTFAWVSPDNRVFVGSWSKLLVFRIRTGDGSMS